MDSLQTLQSIVEKLQALGQREAILQMSAEGITRWSGAEVAEAAGQLARGLLAIGVRPGEFVPILAHNRPEWIIATLGILSAGAAVSPLDSQIKSETLERVLHDSQARFIFTTTDYLNRLDQLNLETKPRPILFDVAVDDSRGWRTLLATGSTKLPAVKPDDPAALFYTSGTTGVPKGVTLTHRNLAFQLRSIEESNLLRPDDRILLPLPMYHVYPFTIGTLTPLTFGLPIVLPQSLTGPQMIRALNEGEVTIIIGVPRVYRAIYNGLEGQIKGRGKVVAGGFQKALQMSINLRQRFGWEVGRGLFRPLRDRLGPKVRLLTSGGSALDPDLAWKLEGFGWNVATGYGLTETSPMLTMNLPSDSPKLASVGPPLPGIDLRIEPVSSDEETDRDNGATPGEGEILARGQSVFTGYRNRPEETAKVFTEDGWFRTGDLGYLDEEGYLYISGRASTLIVLEGGKKIQPEPLEEIYEQHEFIKEIGILYEDNQLVAVIVPEIEAVNRLRNGDVPQAIREAVSERVQAVPSYQRITDYAVTDVALPRTNLGKIRRHILVDYFRQAKQGGVQSDAEAVSPIAIADMSEKDQTLLDNPAARQVWEWLAERYADKRLTPDTSPQLDLGVDSLEWLTLTLQVSELTGIELSDEAIARVGAVRDLLQEVLAASEQEETVSSAALANPEAMLTEEQLTWLTPLSAVQERIAVGLFWLFQQLARLLFRVKARGLENLPADGNFVLTPNHSSMLDAPMVAAALPLPHARRTTWAGAREIMLANPFMHLVSRLGRILPIDRFGGGTGVKNLALAIASLKRDNNLVWFPEGRISTTGEMLPFREGIGLVLEQQATPVIPVYIEGTRAAMPSDAALPKLKPVTITFGPPFDPAELAERGDGERPVTRMVQALQEEVTRLKEQAPPPPTSETGLVTGSKFTPLLILGAAVTVVTGVVWYFLRRGRGDRE